MTLIKGNGTFEAISRHADDFQSITASDVIDVLFIQADQPKLVVHAESNLHELIITKIENGRLIVSMPEGSNIKFTQNPYIECSSPLLKAADIHGAADITILELNTDVFSGQIMGSGDMKIKGCANNALFDISGSGDLKAKKLVTKKTNLCVSGSGDSKVHAKEFVGISLTGSGDINIFGNPAQKDILITGSGDVNFE